MALGTTFLVVFLLAERVKSPNTSRKVEHLLKASCGQFNPCLKERSGCARVPKDMCQYYQWTCACCISVNECVVQCATGAINRQKCLRYGDCLPLPQNAPPLRCVHCHQINQAPRLATYPDPTPAQKQPHHSEPPVKKPTQSAVVPELVDIMAGYDQRRSEVFATAAKRSHAVHSSDRSVAWEQAWDELRNSLISSGHCHTNVGDQMHGNSTAKDSGFDDSNANVQDHGHDV